MFHIAMVGLVITGAVGNPSQLTPESEPPGVVFYTDFQHLKPYAMVQEDSN